MSMRAISNVSVSPKLRFQNLKQISRRSTREELLNVFTPNSIIITPAKFAGRRQQLEQMIDALLAQGADLVVFGERGSGKSSLAHMLYSIAKGELELLDYYGLREYLDRKGFLSWLFGSNSKRFNVIWVDGFGRYVDEVIRSILTRRREGIYGPGLLAYLSQEADQVEVSSKIGFNKVFVSGNELKEVYIPEKPLNIKEGFEIAMQRYADQYKDELIIIVDEFETVKNRSEISQFLKSAKRARFVLVGITTTILELIGEHASVARDTHAVELKPMDQDELREVLEIGRYILRPSCNFHEEAIDQIVHQSHGSPFWCHFLAKALLQQKIESTESFDEFIRNSSKANEIKPSESQELMCTLPEKAECKIWEEALKQLTMGDEITAKVLLGMARTQKGVISSVTVANQLEEMMDIGRDITLLTINDMLKLPSSPFEERGRIREVVSFSFRDPNFKRYILLRNAGLRKNQLPPA